MNHLGLSFMSLGIYGFFKISKMGRAIDKDLTLSLGE